MPRKAPKSNFMPAFVGLAIVALGLLAWAAKGGMFQDSTVLSNPTLGEDNMSVATTKVLHANESTFASLVLQAGEPVLVDFYADWCGPCQRIAPVLEQLASELPNAKIVKVNVDHSPGLASKYNISSIPNLIVFRNGKATDQLVGLVSKNELKTLLAAE